MNPRDPVALKRASDAAQSTSLRTAAQRPVLIGVPGGPGDGSDSDAEVEHAVRVESDGYESDYDDDDDSTPGMKHHASFHGLTSVFNPIKRMFLPLPFILYLTFTFIETPKDAMHVGYLGVFRKVANVTMGLPAFQTTAMRTLLVSRMAKVAEFLQSKFHVPTISSTKSDGHFNLPVNKAADSKNFFVFFALSIFEGLLPTAEWNVLELTVSIASALASGEPYTMTMADELQKLIDKHHILFAEVHGIKNVVPNFHACAVIF